MRRSALLALLPAILLLALAVPGSVVAFPLSTCTLSISSTDGSGAPLDAASSGAADATHADPFVVVWEGQVAYTGSTNVVIKNYTYGVSVFGVPTPIRGADNNADGDTGGEGAFSVAANSPFRAAGLYFVSGTYSGEGGSCAGSGWFLLRGDPVGTLPWILGAVLLVMGFLGYVAGSRGHVVTSVVGGTLFGVGAALLLISHAALPLAENTPAAIVVAAILLGIVIGLLGRRARRDRQVAVEDAPPPLARA